MPSDLFGNIVFPRMEKPIITYCDLTVKKKVDGVNLLGWALKFYLYKHIDRRYVRNILSTCSTAEHRPPLYRWYKGTDRYATPLRIG